MRAHTKHGFSWSQVLDAHRNARFAGTVDYNPRNVWDLQAAADYRLMAKNAKVLVNGLITTPYRTVTDITPESAKALARRYLARHRENRLAA